MTIEPETLLQSILPKEQLKLHAFRGREALSEPFLFEVSALNPREQPELQPLPLLGTKMSVHYQPPYSNDDRVIETKAPCRYFHGYVTKIVHEGYRGDFRYYQIELRPWLWLLDKTSNCRVFQNKSVPDIVTEVFTKNGFTDVKRELNLGEYKPREYCVQYRETDLAFVSRLLEHEGIYYYFQHERDRHVLVLADGSRPHEPLAPQYATLEYAHGTNYQTTTETLGGRIHDWCPTQQVCAATYALKDYDFEKPALPLNARLDSKKPHEQSRFEQFDYPGGYRQAPIGDRYARIRLQEEQALFDSATGTTTSPGVAPGSTFTLEKFPSADQNVKHLMLSAEYDFAVSPPQASYDLAPRHFSCRLTALKTTTTFRPRRATPRPMIHGVQTAKVVGPPGEEIATDKYGRVKVQFPWDRMGKFDVDSSCWIRVAQVWAGSGWGVQHVPRIGNEVVVSFLEGDPDKPLIVGSVYNGANAPPFALPERQFMSGVMTDSTKSATGYNELSFKDQAAAELVFLRAQRDLETKVLRERRADIGANDIEAVQGDQSITITNSYSLKARTAEIRCGASVIRIGPEGISITAPTLTLTSTGPATLTASNELNIQAPKIDVLGSTAIPVLHAIPLGPRPPV